MKRVRTSEVFERVAVRLPEDSNLDEVENHFAEVLTAFNAPVAEDRRRHWSELLERMLANALEELLTGDMPGAFTRFLAQLDRVIERVFEEVVSFGIEARIIAYDALESFGKIQFLHKLIADPEGRYALALRDSAAKLRIEFEETLRLSEQRAELMRDAWDRQRSALTCALCWWLCTLRAFAGNAPEPSAAHGLQAAKLLEAAALADGTNSEEQRELERLYRALIARFPRDAAIRNGYAEFLWSKDERDSAVEQWRTAQDLDPKNGTVLTHLGGALIAAGQTRQGIDCYARAAESAPENASFHFNLGNATFLFRHELLDRSLPSADAVAKRALSHFADAARLEPLNPEFARAYAETFYSFAKPDWNAARDAWQHFLEISPQKDFAFANLARVYLKLGQKEEARACVAKIEAGESQRLKTRLLERIELE
jgi:Flp pilus assembly protein TadD